MCGVIGIIGNKNDKAPFWAAYETYRGLLNLQHRGQDAAGILSFDSIEKRFHQEKDLGLVAQVFNQNNISPLVGNMAIGHTRYATVGGDGKNDLQPLVTGIPFGAGMVHNGNLVNYHSLAEHLKKNLNQQLLTHNDLEVLLNLWCHSIFSQKDKSSREMNFNDCKNAAKTIFETVQGGYAVVGLMAGAGLFAFRDPDGIRPLILGKRECLKRPGSFDYCVASESLALNFLGFEYVRDLDPGEVLLINESGVVHSKVILKKESSSHCMFEWIYFSGAEGSLEGRSVYGARLNLGKVLARKVNGLLLEGEISPDIVCPVPDTSRTASISLAENLRLPYREGLIKNRYVQRSFILDTQEKREKAVELKLSPVRSEIEGKNILLVDDSVVRGTTSKKIIDLLKRYGAKDITLAITCPPLRNACYYGIDFPAHSELIANGKNLSEIAQWVGANRVVFLEEKDVAEAIGLKSLCMACVNNKYPTSIEDAGEFLRRRKEYKNNMVR